MTGFGALASTLFRSRLREPVGFFFAVVFAPALVLILGFFFGNEPNPDFGGRGYIEATLPAFASLVLAMTGVVLLPVNLITLRETGALRRLSLTPLRAVTFVAADVFVNFVVGFLGILAALTAGWLVFGVPMPSGLLSVLVAAALGLVAFLALGYALAALYPSSAAATGIGNLLMIVLMLSSGAFVPSEALPDGTRRVMEFSPVRQFVELLQGLWVGEAWTDLWLPTTVLSAMVVVFSAVGATRFRWD